MIENIPFKRPLVIGTGGGNDIVSACILVSEFNKRGIKADLAGVCSPGAFHLYGPEGANIEKSVNYVTKNSKRFIPSKNPTNLSFIDSFIPGILTEEGMHTDVYNLSCRYGTSKLISSLNDLISEKSYDGVVAVDVGGDILARGKKDPTILSPLMDFTILHALDKLHLPSVLIEFGLQTDGELRPSGCEEILRELNDYGAMLGESRLRLNDPSVDIFKRIYDRIKGVRHGHTAAMTLQTLESQEDIHTEYRFGVRVLDKKLSHSFPITLESKYFGKVFLIDPKKLAQKRELAFPYENTLELFVKTKQIVDTKTEMDLLYNHDSRANIWLGMPGPQFASEQRRELIQYGLTKLDSHADVALLWKKDVEYLGLNLPFENSIRGDFVLTSNNADKLKTADDSLSLALEEK